ncbi:hypothetical protein MLD38_017616 [Melastoma candidum]|uniref:Uncharacterized protein n=1 Tax=Melastoma candidum TaxID=119954 RepID=A0ACB9QQN2_9MYRT|nr:hypothetical protein MLD38_017616 [Melastoma candidum]
MAMQTLHFKEHDGVLGNQGPVGQLSSAPWWVQSFNGDSSGHFNSSPAANPTEIFADHLGAAKQGRATGEQGLEKGGLTHFPMFSEGSKSSGDAQKSPVAIPPTSECNRFDIGFGQPMICTKYLYGEPLYGVFSSCGQQIPGRVMLPLNLATGEGPIYVNAKQYNGILRRRKSRSQRAEHENKTTRVRKQYMHFSRHLHAMRRPRGSGGRFLNTRNISNGEGAAGTKKDSIEVISQPTGSPTSEVLQSASGTSNSQKEANGSIRITSGSEVTSTFTRLDLDHFSINHSRPPPPIYSFTGMIENIPRSIVMPSKWVAAADNCCNLKF